jgi:hypothetical protein
MLLAGGRTTREAAAALFLSPKTIEYHLRHVYLKLGIHSREELARVLVDSSPVPESADVEAGRVGQLGGGGPEQDRVAASRDGPPAG